MIINLNDKLANILGFTEDKFSGYLAIKEDEPDTIIISLIESKSKQQGNLSKLFNNIWELGFTITVPEPYLMRQMAARGLGQIPLMENILVKKGFKKDFISDKIFGLIRIFKK